MRIIDVVLNCWSFRQRVQQQYEEALPQHRLNTAYLGSLADSKPRDRMSDKPDFIASASEFAVSMGKQAFTRNDLNIPERQPYAVGPQDIDPAQAFGEIEQHGTMPAGGRRHAGILVWEWLVARLAREGIVLECDDEYAALDSMYCEKVAELAAEMLWLRAEHPACPVPLDQQWIRDIEQRTDNEAVAQAIIEEMVTAFGVRPERVEAAEPKRISAQPSDLVIPAEVLNPARETVARGER